MGCPAAVAFTELNVSGDKNLNALKMAITFSGSNIHQIAPGRDGYAAALLHNTTLNCNDKNKPDNVCCCFAQFIQPAFFCFIAMRNSTYPSQPLRIEEAYANESQYLCFSQKKLSVPTNAKTNRHAKVLLYYWK